MKRERPGEAPDVKPPITKPPAPEPRPIDDPDNPPAQDPRPIDDPLRLADEARADREKAAAELRAARIPIDTEPATTYRP